MDFDDLIMTTVHLLQAFPTCAEHWRRRFRHVLVDEYQDTNHAQYVLVRELVGRPAGRCRRPSWASSATPTSRSTPSAARRIRNIHEFERDYPDATTIVLEQNYRSTQRILRAANAGDRPQHHRRPKNLWSDAGDGEQIEGYVADNEHDEAAWVAEQIDGLSDEGAGASRRTSRSSTAPTTPPGCSRRCSSGSACRTRWSAGCASTSAREVRDTLAYLRVIANTTDVVSLRRILNTPRRGIGDRAEACVERFAARERIAFASALRRAAEVGGLATRSVNAINEFVALLEELARLVATGSGPAALLESILDRTGYLTEL